MTFTSTEDTHAFRRSLLRWYRHHGRDLPWRRTRDPYAILVSEVMLQQTQVATVLSYFEKWLRRFPDVRSLARASENDVLSQWQGLGYYSRARNLHAAAKLIQDRHRGIFPRDTESIRELPGIGRYTTNAIATFAFDRSVPVIEANTARLVARLFDVRLAIDSAAGRDALWTSVATLVPGQSAGRFNSALMDLGALVCRSRKPRCQTCPVKKFCRTKDPESLPAKRPRQTTKHSIESHAFIVRQNQILLEQSSTRWRAMWILPPVKPGGLKPSSSRAIHSAEFSFTNHKITLRVFRQRPGKIDLQRLRWFSKSELASIPIPSPHRRAIDALLH